MPRVGQEGTELACSVLTDSRAAELYGKGHLAILTAPELVAAEVSRFLGE